LGSDSALAQLRHFFTQYNCAMITADELFIEHHPSGDLIHTKLDSSKKTFVYHYTSGSTGRPKAALHSQTNLINGGIIYKQTYRINSEDSILAAVPLLHSFGMVAGLITALMSGARLVLIERFIPQRLVKTLAEEKITILLAVPFMYDLMARCNLLKVPDLSALRVSLSSGGQLLPDVAKKFRERYHKPVYQVYGCTEMGVIAMQWPNASEWPEHSVGCPGMGISVRIVDENGRDVLAKEVGNLLVKTPAMFAGYFGHPDATAQAFQDGWYVTGDMAWQDDQGRLYLAGRKDTFINVGGKKVNPLEVEQVLLSHSGVKEAVVFGSDAGSGGEQVYATVVPVGQVSETELIAFCRAHLAFYKVPSHIEFVKELGKTGMGKIPRVQPQRAS
ncbi:partial fatty-acyl-CoA synthase, partial [Anaerolineae bacterium]